MENYIQIEGSKIELTQQQVEQIKSLGITKKKSPQWEEFGEIKGFDCFVQPFSFDTSISWYSKMLLPTKEEAEAYKVLPQLLQWRDKYNEGWKPDWEDESDKYCLYFIDNKISNIMLASVNTVLSFKTETIADKFLEDFRDLIEIAKPLL